MPLAVRIVKAVGLQKDRNVSPYVVVRSNGEEVSTTSKHGGAHPVWNEELILQDAPQEASVSLVVYDKSLLGKRVLGQAVLTIHNDAGEADLKLRGGTSKSKSSTVDPRIGEFGKITVAWTRINPGEGFEHEAAFKTNLVRLLSNAYLIVAPAAWVTDTLLWTRPYHTAALLCAGTWLCYHNLIHFAPAAAALCLLLGFLFDHIRSGPAAAPGVGAGCRVIGGHSSTEDELQSAFPDPFRFMSSKKSKAITHELWEKEMTAEAAADRLDSLWESISSRKRTQASTVVANVLVAWFFAELFGVCPPWNVLALPVLWGVFLWVPLYCNFPHIAAQLSVSSFVYDDGCSALRAAKESSLTRRIQHDPWLAAGGPEYLAPTVMSSGSFNGTETTSMDARASYSTSPPSNPTNASFRLSSSYVETSPMCYDALAGDVRLPTSLIVSAPAPEQESSKLLNTFTSAILRSSSAKAPAAPPRSPLLTSANVRSASLDPRHDLGAGGIIPSPAGGPRQTPSPPPVFVAEGSATRPTDWVVTSIALTEQKLAGDVIYFKVEAEFATGESVSMWARYSQFRSLKMAATKCDNTNTPLTFPGKTFRKCEGKELDRRVKELGVFLYELMSRSKTNLRIRSALYRFLHVQLT
ncbi:hypothetical protein DIPPA_17816 [Diplonema papillatum]|nr:hypothetical protein DIPPA_17816 [Diplonema papillatum]